MKHNLMSLLIFLLLPFHVWAGLGDDVSSLKKDHEQLQAREFKNDPSSSCYVVDQFQTGGVTVKEFSSAGKIFAVKYHGLRHLDLQSLLSSYGPEYVKAREIKKQNLEPSLKAGRRRQMNVTTDNIQVAIGGHQRAYTGLAYLIHGLPSCLKSIEDLK